MQSPQAELDAIPLICAKEPEMYPLPLLSYEHNANINTVKKKNSSLVLLLLWK